MLCVNCFYCRNNLAVVAHSVGLDQVGLESKLGLSAKDMDNDAMRSMIIKDNLGDWGIAVAAWKGMNETPGMIL